MIFGNARCSMYMVEPKVATSCEPAHDPSLIARRRVLTYLGIDPHLGRAYHRLQALAIVAIHERYDAHGRRGGLVEVAFDERKQFLHPLDVDRLAPGVASRSSVVAETSATSDFPEAKPAPRPIFFT